MNVEDNQGKSKTNSEFKRQFKQLGQEELTLETKREII